MHTQQQSQAHTPDSTSLRLRSYNQKKWRGTFIHLFRILVVSLKFDFNNKGPPTMDYIGHDKNCSKVAFPAGKLSQATNDSQYSSPALRGTELADIFFW